MLFRLVSGALILYAIFRLFRKKTVLPTRLQDFQTEPNNYVYKVNEPTQQEIFNFLSREEGIAYKKYPDAKGFSIGIGHFIKPEEGYLLNKTLTDQEVLDLFNKDIQWVLRSINKNVKVPLNKNQKLALISFVFNIGDPQFFTSTLLKRLNLRNYTAAALEFQNWRLSEGRINLGLVERRKREQALFSKQV